MQNNRLRTKYPKNGDQIDLNDLREKKRDPYWPKDSMTCFSQSPFSSALLATSIQLFCVNRVNIQCHQLITAFLILLGHISSWKNSNPWCFPAFPTRDVSTTQSWKTKAQETFIRPSKKSRSRRCPFFWGCGVWSRGGWKGKFRLQK